MALLSEIITDFELFMSDTTELSEAEEIRIAEKHSQRIANILPWEALKTSYSSSGSVTSTTDSLPARFNYLTENNNYTSDTEYAQGPVVFVGSNYSPWKVVSWSDRRRYRDQKGYAWVDQPNSNMVFGKAPNDTIEYDYIAYPAELTATTDTIWIPDRFAPILYHAMCADDFVIQQSEKALSYRDENLGSYNMFLSDMKSWNFKLNQMT